MRPEHIQRRRVGSYSAALPAWAAGKFTDGQAAVMRAVGIEMLNKHGGVPPRYALRLEVIADTAGVSAGRAREALNIADTIGLVTIKHFRGSYDIGIRSPEWLPALRERIEETAGKNCDDPPGRGSESRKRPHQRWPPMEARAQPARQRRTKLWPRLLSTGIT
jgi:hypothetical protein